MIAFPDIANEHFVGDNTYTLVVDDIRLRVFAQVCELVVLGFPCASDDQFRVYSPAACAPVQKATIQKTPTKQRQSSDIIVASVPQERKQ